MRLFGIEFMVPLMLPALFVDGQLPSVAVMIGVFGILALHVLIGRAFCGYICPYGTLSRLVSRLRAPLKAAGLAVEWTPPKPLRWILLAATLLAPLTGMGLASRRLSALASFPMAVWRGGIEEWPPSPRARRRTAK